MRRAIQMLQSLHQLHGGRLEAQAVRDMSGALPEPMVRKVFRVCKGNNFDEMQKLVDDLLADGYPAAQMAQQMLGALLAEGGVGLEVPLSSVQKARIAVQLAETDKALTDGADEYLQLTNLLALVMRVVQ